MGTDVTVLRVFTDSEGNYGNPLGVVDASAVKPADRQRIAAQLGYSETIFVDLPRAGSHTARARIYTPTTELPFAGHPTVGASWWLRARGTPIHTLQVPAGIVAVDYDDGLTTVRARAEWAPEFAIHGLDSPEAVVGADPADYADDFQHYLWACDAETDAHLWAERFDGDTSDLFALQDEVTSRIANTLGAELIAAEASRQTEHPDALDCILRGRAALLKPASPDSYSEAIKLFAHALSLDPRSVEAQISLASSLASRVLMGFSNTRAADLARADELIGRALAVSRRYALAHHVKGSVLRAQERWAEAIPEYETALASNPNLVGALNGLAWCKLFTGSIDEVIPLIEQAFRRSPRDLQTWCATIGFVHLLQSHTDEAIVWLEKARSAVPAASLVHGWLASAYALKGETERAAAELAEARRRAGDDRYSSIARVKARSTWGISKTRALAENTYFAGLRKAGMPEE